jgi:hypothetical protein
MPLPIVNFKLFSDLIDALDKIAKAITALVSLPKAEREKYSETLDETYRLIDTVLNMVIIRLSDVLRQDDVEFLVETGKLGSDPDWIKVEREFRLCHRLRSVAGEAQGIVNQLAGVVSTNEWESVKQTINSVLATEGEVARYISSSFLSLATTARVAGQNPETASTLRPQVEEVRNTLIAERQRLIRQELNAYAAIFKN